MYKIYILIHYNTILGGLNVRREGYSSLSYLINDKYYFYDFKMTILFWSLISPALFVAFSL